MGEALGDILPLAVAVAIFPVPIIAVVLVLGSDRGTAKGAAFVLTAAAGAEIAQVGLPAGRQVALLLGFLVVASAGVLTPLVLALILGDGSRALLEGLRAWMARYNAVIMGVLFLLIGAKLIGDAVSGFSN